MVSSGAQKHISNEGIFLYDSSGKQIGSVLPGIELNTVINIRCSASYSADASQDRWVNSIELKSNSYQKAEVSFHSGAGKV